ncbi:unannotated protein [freshwater metagenome]|uniref:Unannotated protein n=1 Tax=freshwater metagenome TaxID=449393 RepID=A0A6J6SGU9_9ZZZZ
MTLNTDDASAAGDVKVTEKVPEPLLTVAPVIPGPA